MHEQIQGIVPPMVTPFRPDGSIDEAALRADTRYLIETAGAHGLAVCGSTGEGHTLSTEETRLITATVVDEAAGRVPVITTAVDALLYPSFALGAVGSIAAILTAAPTLCVELWSAVQAGDHATGRELHEKLLPIWNAIFADNLPANTRYCMELQGRDGGVPRPPMPPSSDAQKGPIREAMAAAGLL